MIFKLRKEEQEERLDAVLEEPNAAGVGEARDKARASPTLFYREATTTKPLVLQALAFHFFSSGRKKS